MKDNLGEVENQKVNLENQKKVNQINQKKVNQINQKKKAISSKYFCA